MKTHSPSRRLLTLLCLSAAPLLLVVIFLAGCSTTSGSGGTMPGTGPAFVIGTDAPLASVVSFNATIQSLDAITADGTSVSLVSGNPTVDFARYNGLQTLLDMNNVPTGTYTQIAVTFSSATIGYLQTQSGAAPTIQTMNATFTTPTVTTTLTNPLVVSESGPVGVRLDLRLDKSIQVSGGQITGQVDPTLDIEAVGPNDPGAYIDEFDAAVVSVDSSSQSFIIQGPHGRQFTVNLNGSTEWDGDASLTNLTNTSIVQISGILDKADFTIDADEVAILSQDGFYAGGLITYVNPSSGAASNFDMYVRGTLPASGTGVTDGALAQVDLTGQEQFSIYWMHNKLTQYFFNSSTLLPGQHVAVGGSISGAANGQALSVSLVMLRHWGFNGSVVANSVNIGGGSFQMQINGFAGLLIPQTVTVYTFPGTLFRDGLNGVGDVSSATNVRVVGLLLKDPSSGNTIILARYVDVLD